MSKLRKLRGKLESLRRRRQLSRWICGWSAIVVTVLVTLTVLFGLDLLAHLLKTPVGPVERALVMLVAAGVAIWAISRYALPFFGISESEAEIALLVEGRENIDSDLIAALQFEANPEARDWGSPQLEEAVVDYVSEYGHSLDTRGGDVGAPVGRRLATGLVVAGIAAIIVAMLPQHTAVFLQRLAFSSAHYPTRTRIERIVINQTALDAAPAQADAVRSPFGRPVEFTVYCSGELPETGEAKLRWAKSGQEETVVLEPAGASEDGQAVYRGRFARLLDAADYRLYLGDAWTHSSKIDVIPLPVVQPQFSAELPDYARGGEEPDFQPGAMQLTVLEGSELGLDLKCKNKRLTKAWVTIPARQKIEAIAGPDGAVEEKVIKIPAQTFQLAKSDEEGHRWRLPAAARPFRSIERPLKFSIQVEDQDQLSLASPLEGYVSLKEDRPPTVTASMVNRVVVNSARPVLDIVARDDYALGGLRLRMEIVRYGEGQSGFQQEQVEQKVVSIHSLLPLNRDPSQAGTMQPRRIDYPVIGQPVAGGYRLDLLPQLKLAKGDRIELTVVAVDYRGVGRPGRETAMSEPLTLRISDERGVLAALDSGNLEADKQLTGTINLQLGVGRD